MGERLPSYPVVAMKLLFFVFVLASAAALETYTETRDITDSAGNTFSCLYTIVYDPSHKVVYRRQSTVHCDPNTNGKQTTETIIIAEAGMSVDVTYQPRTDKHMPKKTAMMMSLVEEMMQMPSEEQMAEMEQGWMEMMSSMGMDPAQMEQAWADWEAQMEAEWQANGGLMGMLGMTGEDLQMMMQMMEMKAHCKCTSSDVAYGEMAMPTVPMAAGKK